MHDSTTKASEWPTHTIRVPHTLNDKMLARAASFKSFNEYVLHCVRLELKHSDECDICNNAKIADSVRVTVKLAVKSMGTITGMALMA